MTTASPSSIATSETTGLEEVPSPAVMLQRAGTLRRAAEQVPAPLATAYRRRASELELSAWAIEVAQGSELTVDDLAA